MYFKSMVGGGPGKPPYVVTVLARAPHWSGPFDVDPSTLVHTGIAGDDPFVWIQNGTYHMVLHTCCDAKIPTTAWSQDGITWASTPGEGHDANGFPAFSEDITLTNGTVVQLARRQRHQILQLSSDGAPLMLFKGVAPRTAAGGEGGHTYTAVQPFA